MNDEAIVIGVDLGGTEVKSASLRIQDGTCLHRKTVATRAGEFDREGTPLFVEAVRQLIALHEEANGCKAEAIGISAPGLANREGSAIAFMPGRMEGLEGLVWGEVLDHGFERGIPVLNDAHAALLGEVWQGAAQGLKDVFMLTLGTGVGGAVVSDGRLLRGHLGRAGHLGHVTVDFRGPGDICGAPGTIEDAMGNHSIQERSGGRFSTTHQLVDACVAGDEVARKIWLTSVRALAALMASMVNVLDPEAIVIGGGIGEAGAPLMDPLREFMEEFEWRPSGARVELRSAQLGTWAGAYGAAHASLQGQA